LDQVRDQVTRYVVQKSQSELILKLREEAKVERTEPEKPAEPAPGATAPPAPETKTPANPAAPATSSK
jgi:peptidyl-prolyl cis-trans isomerase C